MICLNGKLRGVRAEMLGLDAVDNYDLKDGPGNNPHIFRRAVGAIGRFARRHPKLLVQCHVGRSRSVIEVAAHLIRSHG
jgi:protein-tyrosine phosphatase